MRNIIITLVAVTFASFSRGVDYCRSKMCAYTNAHTFCQYSEGRSVQCTGYIHAILTEDEKMKILERLNRRRNEVAAGRMRRLPGASNMMKLRWVGELESEAQLWADQCRPPKTPEEQDACRDLYSVTVGQCVASVVGEAPGLKVESMVDMWYMQGVLYKGNITLYEPPLPNKRYYGDFAQMMWARTYMVGCARSRFMQETGGRFRSIERLVCNFGPRGPAPYRALWRLGAPAAACPPRASPDLTYTALCDYHYEWDDSVDKNNSMTLEEEILLNAVLEIERNNKNNSKTHISLDEKYLTIFAIASISDSIMTTLRIDSMQKRDIAENKAVVIVDNGDSNEVDITTENHNVLNQTILNIPVIMTKAPKKKLKLVGRPKSYNVEELSGIGGDHRKENLDTLEDVHKRKALFDVDDEYNNIDNFEENTIANDRKLIATTVTGLSIKTEGLIIEDTSMDYLTLTKLFVTEIASSARTWKIIPIENIMTPLENREKISSLRNYVDITTEMTRVDLNMTFVQSEPVKINEHTDEPIKEYVADPESVGEMQAALERMEQEGHDAAALNNPVKIRRALRDVTQEAVGQNEVATREASLDVPSQEPLNGTDRNPMLKMVMKYMPYLQKYKQDLIGPNSARSICQSLFLVLLLAFIV